MKPLHDSPGIIIARRWRQHLPGHRPTNLMRYTDGEENF